MISMKFCSTALTGQPVDMTVSQNGVKRALNVEAFGVPKAPPVTPAPTTRLTISLRRGQQQVAPEGIAFFANISGFDAQPKTFSGVPAYGEVYDEAMHDITYVWDFGDEDASTTAYERMLPQWRDNNVGYGPFPSHVFANPGTYTILCGAYERSSGKQAFASYDVTVEDPNVYFTHAQTICIAPDGNFTNAPTSVSANRVTTLEQAEGRWISIRGNGPTRVLLKSGQVHTVGKDIGWGGTAVYINTWGGTDRAIVKRSVENGNDSTFIIFSNDTRSGSSISNIDYQGGWNAADPISSTSYNPTSFLRVAGGHCAVYNCQASGIATGYGGPFSGNSTTIFANCSVTGWRSYGFWLPSQFTMMGNPSSPLTDYLGIVGCRATQDVQATQNGVDVNGNPGIISNHLGPLRTGPIGYLHIDGFEAFSRTGWSLRSNGTVADTALLRDHRNDSRSRGFFSRLFGEGGFTCYSAGSGQQTTDYPCNTVIDKFMILPSANTTYAVSVPQSCVTVRNGLIHEPNVKNDSSANPYSRAISFNSDKHDAANQLYPVKVYNVSIINEQDTSKNAAAWQPYTMESGGWVEGQIQIENVVVHRPNVAGGFVGDGPLDATRLGIQPRYLGFKWYGYVKDGVTVPAKLTMDTSYATPANAWSLWRPQAGSPAIGSATGDLVAYDDLLGNVRPAQASRGAVEPA